MKEGTDGCSQARAVALPQLSTPGFAFPGSRSVTQSLCPFTPPSLCDSVVAVQHVLERLPVAWLCRLGVESKEGKCGLRRRERSVWQCYVVVPELLEGTIHFFKK